MKRDAIFHSAKDNMCYALDRDEIYIGLMTGKDIKSVEIQWGDPFEAGIMGGPEKWKGKVEKISEKIELENHYWWTVKLKPKYKRCKYFFTISDGEETLCYFEDGFCHPDKLDIPGKRLQYFFMPWMNSADIFTTPDWVQDAVWYQIFPERFARFGEQTNDHKPWKSEPIKKIDFRLRYGGNLKGITSRLPYLKELGITALYLTPIFKSYTDHKYDIIDYYAIDEDFGTKEDLKELCNTAHSMGIRIMLDMVMNHCSPMFKPFSDVMENGENSRYKNWFMINKFPVTLDKSTRDGRFYSFGFFQYMPKINTNNPDVIDYFADVCKYWVEQFGVDGLRFDVASGLSHKFLRTVRDRVKAVDPDVYLLAEIWQNSMPWLRGDEFDAIMNYPLTEAISGFWRDKTITSKQFEQGINHCLTMYPVQALKVMFNLLDSHDTERLYYRSGHDEDIFYQQLVLLFSLYGSPCIYYGTEIMMDGAHDPDCRRCMPWDEIDSGKHDSKIQQIKAIINARKEYPELKSMNFEFIHSGDNRVLKMIKDKRLLIAINADEKPINLEFDSVVFSRKLNGDVLEPGGCAICTL